MTTLTIASLLFASVGQSAPPPPTLRAQPIIGLKGIAFAPAPAGSRVAVSLESGEVRILDAATRQTVRTLGVHPQPAYGLAWSPDGKWIASGDETARIWLWDAATGKRVREMRDHQRGIQSLAFSADSKRLLSTGKDDVARIYDVATGKVLIRLPGDGANYYGARFLPSGNVGVATLGEGLRTLNPRTGQVLRRFNVPGGQGALSVAFDRRPFWLASGGKCGNIGIWDVGTGRRVRDLKGHQDWIVSLALAPNQTVLASSSPDRTVRLWRPGRGEQLGVLENMSSVGSPLAWTADGRFLLATTVDDFVAVVAVSPAQRP